MNLSFRISFGLKYEVPIHHDIQLWITQLKRIVRFSELQQLFINLISHTNTSYFKINKSHAHTIFTSLIDLKELNSKTIFNNDSKICFWLEYEKLIWKMILLFCDQMSTTHVEMLVEALTNVCFSSFVSLVFSCFQTTTFYQHNDIFISSDCAWTITYRYLCFCIDSAEHYALVVNLIQWPQSMDKRMKEIRTWYVFRRCM